MRVLDLTVYRGPSLHSSVPMVRFGLDLEELESFPTSRLGTFVDDLMARLPGLQSHGCSLGREGGFVERMRDGTWIGHVIEHVAIELQCLAGSPVTRGKTRSMPGHVGCYHVMFTFNDPKVGTLAARLAVELVADLLPDPFHTPSGLDILAEPPTPSPSDGSVSGLTALRTLVAQTTLGPTTASLVEEAERRNIPVARVDRFSLIRLGYGRHQKLMRASITGSTSHIAVENAGNKNLTKSLLSAAELPVPKGSVVRTAAAAVAAATALRVPVVVKPADANHGRGVTTGVTSHADVETAFVAAMRHSSRVIVEEHFTGRDYRVLVVNGRVVAVAERVPPHIVGDGSATIEELIAAINADPRRGAGHEKVMTRIPLDATFHENLARRGFTLATVLPRGEEWTLRETANLSTGGAAIDRTDSIHPENRALAEHAARVIGLDIAGLDILTPDISVPITEAGGGIIEVNAAPGFRMHLAPSSGRARNVAKPVIDMLYPPGNPARIPIVSVTGTNGKSTTVRMIAHLLTQQGLSVGMTTTSGIYIGGEHIRAVDASGPRSARVVLSDPGVDAAVLEVARGGLIREGLAYDRSDVGIALNVSADHLGLKGIDTLRQLADVKSVVVRQVARSGLSVLNADDPLCVRMAKVAGGQLAFFTSGPIAALPWLVDHVASGLWAASVEGAEGKEILTLHDGTNRSSVIESAEIPATLGGMAMFNVRNALAALLAAHHLQIPLTVIQEGLRTFDSSFETNPGRLNLTQVGDFRVILDYAHNPAALRALGAVVTAMRGQCRRTIGVVSIPGDRRDQDILHMGQIAAHIFDEIIFRERPDGRGRESGGVTGLLTEGALAGGAPAESIRRILDERQATDAALRLAEPNDLVVIMPTDVNGTWEQIRSFTRDASMRDAVPASEE